MEALVSVTQIIRAPILPWGLVNAHIVRGPKGAVLVDAGLPGTQHRIEQALRRAGMSMGDIKLIVITHAHVDHAGNAARLRALTGAPIVAHAGDLAHYRREAPMTFCSTGWFGRAFLRTGLMNEPHEPFTPDILLKSHETMPLGEFGLHGQVVHTPGHTAGSISVSLDDGQHLVGDLIASGILLGGLMMTQRPKRPPFEDQPELVAQQLTALVDAGGKRFYMGHGGPLGAAQVTAHARSLTRLAQ